MDTNPLSGQQIDQYRILRHIARGGMADVYLAEDVDLERKVALKIMLDALAAADPQFAERFRREAITVAKLDHPNIVQVYNVGQTTAGQPYIAIQYIEGGSLQDKLAELADRKKLLTTEQALNIVRQIALALAAAHQAGIVHRDLKPANVLIRPDGTPVLVDLGIAAVQDGAKLTQTGSVIGTPAYMSPEQVRGVPLDGRADLYSLGIMLYEMLTGIRPFDADSSVAILHKQVYEPPLPLDKFRPDLSPQTINLVETALQKDPAHRCQSADEMVQAIDKTIKAEGLSGPNPQATVVLTQMNDSKLLRRSGLSQPPGGMRQQRPAWQWGIALLLLLTTAVLLFFAFRPGDKTPVIALAATGTAVTLTQQADTSTSASPTTEPTAAPSATPLPPTATIASTATLPPTASPTRTPTLAPSPTPTLTPSPTPVKVVASPATSQTFRNTPSIWKLTSFQDMQQPGTETYRVTVNAGEIWRWSFSWCAINDQRLQAILAPLTVNFLLDDTPLPDSQLLQHTVDEASGWKCRYWSTILSDWQQGETVKLEVLYYLDEAIYDGRANYAVGEYRQTIMVNIQ